MTDVQAEKFLTSYLIWPVDPTNDIQADRRFGEDRASQADEPTPPAQSLLCLLQSCVLSQAQTLHRVLI